MRFDRTNREHALHLAAALGITDLVFEDAPSAPDEVEEQGPIDHLRFQFTHKPPGRMSLRYVGTVDARGCGANVEVMYKLRMILVDDCVGQLLDIVARGEAPRG